MADELTISVTLAFAKGVKSVTYKKTGQQFDVSGTDYIQNTQIVGTAEEALRMGEVTTPGYIIIANLDSTNYVSLRAATGGANTVELKPGECACFRLARTATAPYVIADTAPVEIEYVLIED
jgi:hypothetical protein